MAKLTRRSVGFALTCTGVCFIAGPLAIAIPGQEQAPNRPEFTIVAKDFHFAPDRIEVTRDDVVKLTVRSEDVAHSFSIDEYRIVKRVPGKTSITFEFRADQAGTFPFYCNLTTDPGCKEMRGIMTVRAK